MKFRKLPIEIEACQFMGTLGSVANIVNTFGGMEFFKPGFRGEKIVWALLGPTDPDYLEIYTPEGTIIAEVGDWIIRDVNGEFYTCKPDIFEKTYEKVE